MLIISVFATACFMWESLGCTSHRIRPVELLSRDFDPLIQQIQDGKYQILWVDMVPQIHFAPATRFNAVWSRFRTILQSCLRAQVSCFLAGVRKSAWTHPAVEQLKADQILFHSVHRWCHFGITLSPGSTVPSSVNMHMLSSMKLPNHACKCGSHVVHEFDIDSSYPNRAHLRAQAEKEFGISLLTTLGAVSAGRTEQLFQESEMPTDFKHSEASNRQDRTSRAFAATTATSETDRSSQCQQSQSYPTEQKIAQREREKAMSKEELEKKQKKKKKVVEQHFDDCGSSLKGLELPEESLNEDPVDHDPSVAMLELQEALAHFTCEGGFGSSFYGRPTVSTNHIVASSIEEAYMIATQKPSVEPSVDIIELCGGEGLTTYLCHKRRLKVGANFDIITGVDLTDPRAQRMVVAYVSFTKPFVAIMSPICGPFGPLGGRNRVLHHDSWLRSCEVAVPLAEFCGVIAQIQMQANRHFLMEQPFPSQLYKVQPWPSIREDPRCLRVVFDQCMVKQTVKGWPVKKPTELLATHRMLLKRFEHMICHNQHQHLDLLGGNATYAQKWSWDMCNRIAQSIKDLLVYEGKIPDATSLQIQKVYPSVSTATEAEPEGSEQPLWRKCKGCLWRLHKFSPQHSRKHGECKYADTTPMVLDCPACNTDKPRSHPGHTFEPGCRHVLTSARSSGVREPRAPRPARVPASEDPTSQLRPEAPPEPEVPNLDAVPELSESRLVPIPEEDPHLGDDGEETSGASGSREQRIRPVAAETQTPDLADWTKFNLQAALRELHFGSQAARLRALRRLHLRWWHSGSTTMVKILRAAGVPSEVLDLVPSVCDTCRICRAWNRPNNSVATARMITAFNQEVEADVVYMKHEAKQYMFVHCVDRATRWCATSIISNRQTESLLNALDTMWVAIFGPMKVLIFDGELGLDDEASTWYFQVRGIEKRTSAVHQHTRIADRRVQILKNSIHKILGQFAEEGIAMPFVRVLAEATFVINAISTAAGSSPYVAVMGRSPALMPELGPRELINDDRDEQCPIRHAARLRATAISTIAENTARERLRGAWKTHTRPTGEELKFNVGDSVEYYREPTNRDVSGWRGPAVVADLTRLEHGRVGIRTSTDQVINCRVQDVRHRLAYLQELQAPISSQPGKAQEYLQSSLEELKPGTVMILGQVLEPGGNWIQSSQTTKHGLILHASLFIATTMFQLTDVVAVRVASGVKTLTPKPEYTHSLTLWWIKTTDRNISYHEASETRLHAESLAGDLWKEIKLVQFLCVADVTACIKDNWRVRSDENVTAQDNQENRDHVASDRLSTIPEEDGDGHGSSISIQSANSQAATRVLEFFGKSADLSDCTVEEKQALGSICLDLEAEAESTPEEIVDQSFTMWHTASEVDIPSWQFVESFMCQEEDGLQCVEETLGEYAVEDMTFPDNHMYLDADEQGVYVAIDVQWPLSKVVEGLPTTPSPNDTVEIRCYEAHTRKAVIDRSDDLLTQEEMRQNAAECLDAVHQELKTWKDLKCFTRRPRHEAPTIIDTKWVFKWKYISGVRKIRARLTLRGFKESGSDDQNNYAATATKWSQRLIVSECVLRRWSLASTDISKAFLQGVTYEELAQETNQTKRDVSFELCNRAAVALRKLPGMEGFDTQTEVLHCLKPGTGCRDAPRCFAIKLRQATKSFGLKSTLVDSELEMLWDPSTKQPTMLILKHVDDIKIAGPKQQIEAFVNHLMQTFGKLEIHWHQFTFCGIKHIQNPETCEIEMNQTEFIKAIKVMPQPEIANKPGGEIMPTSLQKHFLSLLMTIAYAVQSRPDIAVYVAALQKESQQATFKSARKLNKVLLWAQKNPRSIKYNQLDSYPDTLVLVSDSAFRAREQDGLSMRGLACLRMSRNDLDKQGDMKCHLLHTVSKSQRHVTRSTFASELFAGNDSMDFGLLQRLSLHEMCFGHITWERARQLQEETAEMKVKLALVVDARSVTASIIAPTLKAPAECSTLVAVAWLRQKLQSGELDALYWSDTRVMIADGLTKGSINRKELHQAMAGIWRISVSLILQTLR